jgi:hypothetical protein
LTLGVVPARHPQPRVELRRVGAGEHLLALCGRDDQAPPVEHREHRLRLVLATDPDKGLAFSALVDRIQVHRQLVLVLHLLRG